ncbi:hypothetical protein J1N35_023275 [Gossypium stocksii]|uniref:Uncharacterized protein n=1 Tax=Gossypium stocksii TaxID=47602 RepID=A0A9D4A4A3_9ROSI|nr:hypothetical protein J1N35_023275 [Gossypium stocksii]
MEMVQTLSHLDKDLTRKHAFDLFIARLCNIKRIEESLCVVQTMLRNGGLNSTTFHSIVTVLMEKKMEEVKLVVDLILIVEISLDATTYNIFYLWHTIRSVS